MAEIIQKDGTWTFDGDTVRIVPGNDKSVSRLRRTLGEIAVPLRAVAGLSYESGRKSGRLRLRLRDGADPLAQITGGALDESSDPYRLKVDNDRSGVAEYLVDEVRTALLLEQVPPGPADGYLLPGPAVPITVSAGDATVSFDGERIRLEWKWQAEEAKISGGPRTLELAEVSGVEWMPSASLENGFLRFSGPWTGPGRQEPKYDPYAVELWGFRNDPLMALLGAAVVARIPHPRAATAGDGPAAPALPPGAVGEPAAPAATGPSATAPDDGGHDHDALLRRLRELGELRTAGILTDEEFATAKQAVLRRM
ncbi:DUF4429 domain-containing protein [Streptomyces sp. t39]|uniref:DUF4429 domain-containing protein n=1 Tax=Streptomyces sp. t39 TaxID=1828156 RepID=UPI0011CE7477|nr:DUF4429 domain-containing protein [Streptomyces sp. t39]TXS55300.1 DUF4429 domain-containing protein [Streptomyces sp. t39]